MATTIASYSAGKWKLSIEELKEGPLALRLTFAEQGVQSWLAPERPTVNDLRDLQYVVGRAIERA